MKVSLRVKELVDASGVGKQELASQTGIDADTLSRIYNGESVEMDLTALGSLAQFLGVLPNELIAEVAEPQQSVIDTGEMPRSIDVPVQGLDEVKKERTDPNDPATESQRL